MEFMKQLTEEGVKRFQEGISMTFSKWWALQMAIENGWGGPHSRTKALDFASRVFDYFHQPNRREPPYIDDLEGLLDEGLDSFNTTASDGSVEEVAEQLMIMYEECLDGNYLSIQKLSEVKSVPVPHNKRQDAGDSDEEGEEDEDVTSNMIIDSPASLPNSKMAPIAKYPSTSHNMAEAEDGWVQVTSKKNRGRRN